MIVYFQFFNLFIGIITCYMLSKVKREHMNKLGSYQEIAYFFTKSRAIIFIISIQYCILPLSLSAYAL